MEEDARGPFPRQEDRQGIRIAAEAPSSLARSSQRRR